MNYFETLMSDKKDSVEDSNRYQKIFIIIEVLIVTFLFSIIPQLIQLGRPPESITEIYTQILTAILMALYAYMRIRNIKPPEGE